MYEQSTSININQLIRNHGKNAPGTFDSRSHLLPQGGYTGGGGTLMAPSKTIARRPGQHKLGKLAPGGIWWNLVELVEQGGTLSDHSPIRHARYLHVRVHSCACSKIWTDSTYLGSILPNEYKSCMQRLLEIIKRIFLKTHNSTFCTCHHLNIPLHLGLDRQRIQGGQVRTKSVTNLVTLCHIVSHRAT